MQTKRQLKRCTQNVHPSFADFRPGLGVNFHILLTQNWLWESSLSLLSLWCILFQIKLGLFRKNLNLKKHLGPKNGWSSPSTFWHRLICVWKHCIQPLQRERERETGELADYPLFFSLFWIEVFLAFLLSLHSSVLTAVSGPWTTPTIICILFFRTFRFITGSFFIFVRCFIIQTWPSCSHVKIAIWNHQDVRHQKQ